MTCIVAQKSKNGAVMVADRRVLSGYEAEEQEKMFILPNGAVIGAAGGKFMLDYFLPQMKEIEAKDFTSLAMKAEDIVSELYKRYRPRFGYNWPGFGVLIMGLDKLTSGAPRIKLIEEEGFSEEVETYSIVGHGSPYASPFVRLLHEYDSSILHMWRGSFFAISMVERLELDESVGGLPDVIILEPDSKPHQMDFREMEKTPEGSVLDPHFNDWKWLSESYLKRVAFKTWEASAVDRYFKDDKTFEEFAEKVREEMSLKYYEEIRKRQSGEERATDIKDSSQ